MTDIARDLFQIYLLNVSDKGNFRHCWHRLMDDSRVCLSALFG